VAPDPRPLDGRVAVVTGVGRRAGIGYAISRRLLESGTAVLTQAWTPYDVASWGAKPGDPPGK
jgi:NAD(P)-dependent dehydrogenase (short-subunit alcohol dehydrogenase family)